MAKLVGRNSLFEIQHFKDLSQVKCISRVLFHTFTSLKIFLGSNIHKLWFKDMGSLRLNSSREPLLLLTHYP